MRDWRLALAPVILLVLVGAGCAATGSLGDDDLIPEAVVEVSLTTAGPIDDGAYYYFAFDTDADGGATFPVPVAAGPYWGNGWGTGSISYFIEYHLGQYDLFRTQLNTVLESSSGGLEGISGTAAGTAAGIYELEVQSVTLGAVAVNGTGPVTAVTNNTSQNAGDWDFTTDGSGDLVAGSVVFTPASPGGRALTGAEQIALDALNAGGVALTTSSFAPFGLTLTLGGTNPGTQTLTVAPTTAAVRSEFTSASTGQVSIINGSLTANSSVQSASPPVPGLVLLTGTLATGDTATISVELSPNAVLVTPDYFEGVLPQGGRELKVTFDLAALGENLTNISYNVITVRELIFDPTVTNPDDHVYDGFGPLGNDALRNYDPRQFQTITNDDAFPRELAGDSTLEGPAGEAEKEAVDLVDWSIEVRRL
jgi:hypothetical protein